MRINSKGENMMVIAEKGLQIPVGYKPELSLKETEKAIKDVKDFFEKGLAAELNLVRVSAPLFVEKSTGLNDNLNGIERPVEFDIKDISGEEIEIVQSLAKWKRMALKRYGFKPGEGLYTDMNAIRRDEELDNLHSAYVDQWDWEKVIERKDRNPEYLKETVRDIYGVFRDTEAHVSALHDFGGGALPDDIYFITTQELEDMYPGLSPKEREDAICSEKKAVFLMQIGGVLESGMKHDGRAPDYDDWTLNGDIIFWYPPLERAFELSSMGIRVDRDALLRQLKEAGCEERKELEFYRMLLDGELPYTIGGGIGQSRICMFFLRKAHIGEVQSALWPDPMVKRCAEANIFLL